jgi:hypothetical protein
MSDPASIYNAVNKIVDSWPVNDSEVWPDVIPVAIWQEVTMDGLIPVNVNILTEAGRFTFNTQAYAVSCANGDVTEDYYLIQLFGTLRYPVPDTLACDGYTISIVPVNSNVMYVESAPQTTQGETSTTTSTSTTISGNLGFMGDTPTGGIGGSLTTSTSNTLQLPGVVIQNNCLRVGQSAEWRYVINDGSPVVRSDFQHFEQILFKIDRQAGISSLDLNVTLSVHVSDHGGGGTRWFDEYAGAVGGVVGSGAFSYDPGQDRQGTIIMPPHPVSIPQPPAPKPS